LLLLLNTWCHPSIMFISMQNPHNLLLHEPYG